MRQLFLTLLFSCAVAVSTATSASEVDRILASENRADGITQSAMPVVDDLTFLRRAHIDLIGRIPSGQEIEQYLAWPEATRRRQLVDRLLTHERFADRWTTFFADMLRLRSNATGGTTLIAYVHNAISNDMPYDELSRRLISANGKANFTPEAGFVLGDDADPLQMAAVTSQVFMGVRMSCAQCHDHPFDVWTRKDFYGMAAYFGRTRRIESRLTRVIYTTEADQSSILWPPEDAGGDERRQPMKPAFPIEMVDAQQTPEFVARLLALRAEEEKARLAKQTAAAETSIDDLLDLTAEKATRQTSGATNLDVADDAKRDIRKIDVRASLYRHSELRSELADLVTSPRNRYFSRALVNRVWKELVGRGFVEPVDDFRSDNPANCPQTMDYLAEEFVAGGYNFRELVGMIVRSDAYARQNAPADADFATREELESAFLATPMRRMVAEAMYDSIVTAGHLFDLKHPAGANNRVIHETVRVAVREDGEPGAADSSVPPQLAKVIPRGGAEMAMASPMADSGYALEDAIELDFNKLLTAKEGEPKVDEMRVMSAEELESMRMLEEARRRPRAGMKYVTRQVERVIDENPRFNSSYRMASPAPAGHFLRVFGQPGREELGDLRTDDPSMRQALMMLNGRVSHEASRVGALEPMYKLLTGAQPRLDEAVKLAYLEILTRRATRAEIDEGVQMLGDRPLAGMADLRWVLLNCNEFRFIP